MNAIEELRYLIKAVDKEGEQEYFNLLKPYDITPSQNEILKILASHNGISISQIGELLICGSDNPSRLVNRLMIKGLAEKQKNPVDTRITNIYITAEGKALLEKTLLIEEEFNKQIEKKLDSSQQIYELIEILTNQVQNTRSLKQIELKKKLS